MARNIPTDFPFSSSKFDLSSNSPTPLNSPSTDYLVSIPHVQTPQAGSTREGWHQLPGSPSNPPRPSHIYVPDTPAPRAHQLVNDTPTPAMASAGSWRDRRRAGEHVGRSAPPKIRVNIPDSDMSTSPEIQSSPEVLSSPEVQSSSGSQLPPEGQWSRERGSDSSQNYDTAPELRAPGSSSSDNSRGRQSPDPDDPLPSPPAGEVASHFSQVDGALDEGVPQRAQRKYPSCRKVCQSLRKLPSQLTDLFSKEEKNDDEEQDAPKVSTSAEQNTTDQTWWSKTTKRIKRPRIHGSESIPRRNNRRSARSSLGHLLSGSGAATRASGGTHSSDPRDENRFDNPSAPQAFGAPTHEEDTASPVEPDFHSGGDLASEEATRPGENAASAFAIDGNRDEEIPSQNPPQQSSWQRVCEHYRDFLRVNGWLPVNNPPSDAGRATTVASV